MNPQDKQDYHRVRLEIAKRLLKNRYSYDWFEISEPARISYLDQADSILKIPGLLIRSSDQTLPEANPYLWSEAEIYRKGQKSVVAAGFVRAIGEK